MLWIYIALARMGDKYVWNHGCTEINKGKRMGTTDEHRSTPIKTDERKKDDELFKTELCFAMPNAMPNMTICARRAVRVRILISYISLSLLSVFICVHPWFQIPSFAASLDAPNAPTLTGIDVLEAQNFAAAAGKARWTDHQPDRDRPTRAQHD